MLHRMLMVVGGTVAFNPPSPSSFVLTSAPDGGEQPVDGALRRPPVAGPRTSAGWTATATSRVRSIPPARCRGRSPSTPTLRTTPTTRPRSSAGPVDGKWVCFYSAPQPGHDERPPVHQRRRLLRVGLRDEHRQSAWREPGTPTIRCSSESGELWIGNVRDEPTAGTDSRWGTSKTSSATPTSGWSTFIPSFRIAGQR